MATLGNERYLRHILLLGDGSLLILRGIVDREASTCGQPFENFLACKRSQFNNLLDAQRLKLFPDHSTVNTDTKTWDMSLLITVVKRLFWASLSVSDKSYIKSLKTHRDELKAHPHSMSMGATDYTNSTQLLKTALCHLALGLNADTNSKLQDIIKSVESETIDIKSALQHIDEMNEFKSSFLNELERMVSQVQSEIKEVHADIAIMRKDQLVHHHEQTVDAKKTQEDLSEIKDVTKKLLGFVNRRKAVDKAKRKTMKELQIIAQMDCDDQEKREKATALLFNAVRLIQNENNFSQEEVKTIIHQRIEWYGELVVQLIEDVIDWFTDIDEIPDSSLGFAYKGSIRIPIQCFSKYSIDTQIYYMNSNKCLRRVSGISSTLTKLLGFRCFITCSEASGLQADVLKEQNLQERQNVMTKKILGFVNRRKTVEKAKRATVKELQIIAQMVCDDQEEREKGTAFLFGTVRLIQNEHNFFEEDVKEMIHQRIEWHDELAVQLIEDVIDWFTDIDEIPDSSLGFGFAYEGSIRIPIQCFSKNSIYTQIYYMSSNKCLRRVSGISSTLTKQLDFRCFITCSEASGLLADVLKEHSKTSESTICLPFHCKSDDDLTDIQQTFGKENKHTEKISKTLSDIFDAKITLEPCIYIGMSLPSYESKKIKESSNSLLDPEDMLASIYGDQSDSFLPLRLVPASPSLPVSASFRVIEKEGQQENSLPLELLETYSIRDKTDVFVPNVFALEMLPKEGLILIDRSNKKLKKLDENFKTVSVYDLSETPWDVCYIGEGKAAVSLGRSGILFADVSGNIKMDRVVSLNIFCVGCAFFGNILYIGDKGSIYTYTFGDEKLRLLYPGYQTDIFCRHLEVSQSGEKIYMACVSGIITINANGRHLATVQYDNSDNFADICVIDDGTSIVCDLHSNNLIQLDSKGANVLRTFTLHNIKPYSICYDRQESRLIVGGKDIHVQVYKLPALNKPDI